MEIWKDIHGYNGFYQVSNIGNIRSKDRNVNGRWGKQSRNGTMLKTAPMKNGYIGVCLYDNGIKKTLSVHRLVISSFCGKSNLQCNHKDGDKTNNSIENLEYCTSSENHIHAIKMGLREKRNGEKSNFSKLTKDIVLNIRENKFKLSYKEFSALYGVSESAISLIVNKKNWSHV